MPQRKDLEPRPRCYVSTGEWPDCRLVKGAPPEAVLVLKICQSFKKAYEARGLKTIRAIANKAGISEKTVYNLNHGETWITLPTIARIERNFKIKLWVPQQNVGGPS